MGRRDLDELDLQVFEGLIIELELPLKRAIRDSSSPLDHGQGLVKDLLKGHRPPSLDC
jgi:hypothetical protein